MAVRMIEAFDGRTRHQERLQNSVFNRHHAPRRDSLVVVAIRTVQVDTLKSLQRGIEHHAEKRRQHGLSDFSRKRPRIVGVTLAIAFDAVAEDLVEEHARRAA